MFSFKHFYSFSFTRAVGILYKNELTLAAFHRQLNQPEMERIYLERAQRRLAAFQKFLWNDAAGSWRDRFLNGTFAQMFYVSELVPLWAGVFEGMPSPVLARLVAAVADIFTFPSGVPTSFINTSQQWYAANGPCFERLFGSGEIFVYIVALRVLRPNFILEKVMHRKNSLIRSAVLVISAQNERNRTRLSNLQHPITSHSYDPIKIRQRSTPQNNIFILASLSISKGQGLVKNQGT